MGLPRATPEIEQEHLRVLGPELGPVFHKLYLEMLWLHAKWLEYRKLFAGSDERVDLLNASAPFFFYIVQEVLWDDVLLHIARLTDPPGQQRRYENLSLRCLPLVTPDPSLSEDLDELVSAAESAAGFARIWRDKQIAHRDCEVALGLGPSTLPGVSRRDVEDVLQRFRDVMNRLHSAYFGGEVMFRDFRAGGDADALVLALAVAADLEQQRQERARQGQSRPEDFEFPTVP